MVEKKDAKEIKKLFPIKIERVALGVRYEPQYAVMDSVGSAVDFILRTAKSPFGPEVFPLSQSAAHEHVLLNRDTGDSLRINQQDAILDFHVDTRDLKAFSNLAASFSHIVVRALRDYCKIKSILRYGALVRFEECHASLAKTPIDLYMGGDIPNIRALSVQFSRRLSTDEGISKRGVDDFRNANYIIQQTEAGNVTMAIDYQEYFLPALTPADLVDRPFETFTERALSYYEGEFSQWLKKMQRPAEVA